MVYLIKNKRKRLTALLFIDKTRLTAKLTEIPEHSTVAGGNRHLFRWLYAFEKVAFLCLRFMQKMNSLEMRCQWKKLSRYLPTTRCMHVPLQYVYVVQRGKQVTLRLAGWKECHSVGLGWYTSIKESSVLAGFFDCICLTLLALFSCTHILF